MCYWYDAVHRVESYTIIDSFKKFAWAKFFLCVLETWLSVWYGLELEDAGLKYKYQQNNKCN